MKTRGSKVTALLLAALTCAAWAEAQVAERLARLDPPDPSTLGVELDADGEDAQLRGRRAERLLWAGVVSSVALEPVTAAELLGANVGAIDAGAWFPGADPTAGVTPRTALSRGVDELWGAYITGSVNQVDVQVELVGANGQSDCLSHPQLPSQVLPVQVVARRPVQISNLFGIKYVQGGADFYLDAGSASVAGDYTGTLIVTINQF